MARNVDVLKIIKMSFQTFLKKPFLLGFFTLPLVLSIIMFLISLPLLVYSMYPLYPLTILLSLTMLIFSLWLATIGTAGIVLSVEKIVRNQKVEFLKILNQSVRNSIRLSIAYSLEQMFLIVGLLLFVIPGIFLAVRLSLVVPGCILEKKGLGIKRSWNITKNNFWKIFLILLMWNVAFIVLGYIPYLSLLNIILLPVYLTTLTILYLQLRKR